MNAKPPLGGRSAGGDRGAPVANGRACSSRIEPVGCSEDVLALAALLEQAYRLALAVQEGLQSEACVPLKAANELVDELDDARVLLLDISRSRKAADLLLAGRPEKSR